MSGIISASTLEAERGALVDETLRNLTQRPPLTAQEFTEAGNHKDVLRGVSRNASQLYQLLRPEYSNANDTGMVDAIRDLMPGPLDLVDQIVDDMSGQ